MKFKRSAQAIGLALIVLSMPAQAGTAASAPATDSSRWDPKPLLALCSTIYQRTRSVDPRYHDEFEQLIFRAARIDSEFRGDPEGNKGRYAFYTATEEQKMIVRQMHQDLAKDHFECNSTDFDVTDGTWLKYSLISGSYHALNFAIQFPLDLNVMDNSGETLLDYTQKQINNNKGSPLENELKEFFRRIRNAGGKFYREIERN